MTVDICQFTIAFAHAFKHLSSITNVMTILLFATPSGIGQILVGTNAHSNDELSIHMAKANDLWFHTINQGAHVVLQGSIDKLDIDKAAELASMYSKCKKEPVSYCYASQVSKSKYMRAGQVIVTGPMITL